MTRRDWWLGVGLVVATVLFHAVFPRYEFYGFADSAVQGWRRYDRWSGVTTVERYRPPALKE